MVVVQQKISDQILATVNSGFEGVEKTEEPSKIISNILEIKVFKRRWLVLALFVLYSVPTNFQLFQYTVISNIIRRYYNVSSLAVEWTVMVYMMIYIAMVIPVSYLMDRLGLRWTVLIGATGTCLGSWIKFLSTSPDHFAGVLIGQSAIALSQAIIFTIPGRLAAHWFGPKQVATATAIAFASSPIGVATCFAITPIFVKNHKNIEDIENDLSSYSFSQAIFITVVLAILVIFFQKKPPLPPSDNRALQKANRKIYSKAFWPTIKRILNNRSFILLWNSYGLIISVSTTLGSVLNSFYLAHFKNGEEDVGRIGSCTVIMGVVGSAFFAFILDKTKKFRVIVISVCVLCLLSQILVAVSFIMEVRWMVYGSLMLSGAFLYGYMTVATELCVEITYPESAGISIGIVNISNKIYATILIFICGRMIEAYGDVAGHACFIVNITLATILTVINNGELRRQKAVQISEYDIVPLRVLKTPKISVLSK